MSRLDFNKALLVNESLENIEGSNVKDFSDKEFLHIKPNIDSRIKDVIKYKLRELV